MTRKRTETCCTHIVEQALRASDDFVTGQDLIERTGLSYNRVTASLHHLRKYRAADCLDSGGRLFWYATPDSDTRSRKVEERTPESKPRKPRKPGSRKIQKK